MVSLELSNGPYSSDNASKPKSSNSQLTTLDVNRQLTLRHYLITNNPNSTVLSQITLTATDLSQITLTATDLSQITLTALTYHLTALSYHK